MSWQLVTIITGQWGWEKILGTIRTEFFNKSSSPISQIIDETRQVVLEGAQAADTVNKFFCQVSVALSSKFLGQPSYSTDSVPEFQCNSIPRLSVRRVSEQIKLIDPLKSSAFRNILAKLLKIIFEQIPECLTELLNLCLENAVFPQAWKRAIVVCIPKSGDKRKINNLRPISLFPITGKILEFFLNETIMHHL